jgi:hypothetical protein
MDHKIKNIYRYFLGVRVNMMILDAAAVDAFVFRYTNRESNER